MRTRALIQFCDWLENTPVSETIQTVKWIVPSVQTIHILAIAAVMGSMLMINLRLLGVIGRNQPLKDYSQRFVPVIWCGLPVLLLTGAVMVIGEPARSLANWVFQMKMLLVIAAATLTFVFQRPLKRDAAYWSESRGRRTTAVLLALVSLAIWTAIVFAGRWIAYI